MCLGRGFQSFAPRAPADEELEVERGWERRGAKWERGGAGCSQYFATLLCETCTARHSTLAGRALSSGSLVEASRSTSSITEPAPPSAAIGVRGAVPRCESGDCGDCLYVVTASTVSTVLQVSQQIRLQDKFWIEEPQT